MYFLLHMRGWNTVLLDAISFKISLVSVVPTIIFGADVTHPENGEYSSPSIAVVVASQDWPQVTKYAGLVCVQAHRQELIHDLYKTWHDPVSGGMIRSGSNTQSCSSTKNLRRDRIRRGCRLQDRQSTVHGQMRAIKMAKGAF